MVEEQHKSFRATEVFTPTTSAKLTFVERDHLNNRLVNALWTPGKQIVLYGRSGGGKTTLIKNKMLQVYSEAPIISKCTSSTSFEDCILDAFDQLAPFYKHESMDSEKSKISPQLKAKVIGIEAQIGGAKENASEGLHRRALPPQLTPSFLARLIGKSGKCWILEDFHRVSLHGQEKLAQTMKIFKDTADEFPNARIIAIGAVGSAREIVSLEPDMWNRVAEIEVPLMNDGEIRELISTGSRLMNLELDSRAKESIVKLSNGLGSVCHQICLNMCLNKDLQETKRETVYLSGVDLERAIDLWLEDSADTLKSAYDIAIRATRRSKFDNCRLIVESLAVFGSEGATHAEILETIRKEERQYNSGSLTKYLRIMTSRERDFTLIFDPNSRKYSFSWPVLHSYVRAKKDSARVIRRSPSSQHPEGEPGESKSSQISLAVDFSRILWDKPESDKED